MSATPNARAGVHGVPLLPATALVLSGALMSRIQDTALSIANPSLMVDFGVPAATIAWISLAPMLLSASLLTIFGRLADLRGRRNLYALGIVIFGVGSAFCALSPTFAVLVVARIVQGLGGTLMAANSVAYLIDIYAPSRRGFVVGLWEAGIATGSGIGPLIGGAVIEVAGWQGSFAMIVPMAIAMVAAVPFAMKEPPREPGSPRFDLAGAVLFGVGVAAFLYSLTQASVAGWTSPIVLGSQAVAVACGVLFVRVENRVESPMIDLRMFRSRTFTAGNLAATLAWSGDVIYYNVWGGYPNLQFVFPEGGALIWVDNMMIPASATNPVGAIQLMDWVYQPEIAQKITEWVFYMSPCGGVKDLIATHAAEERAAGKAALADKLDATATNENLFPSDALLQRTKFRHYVRSDEEAAEWDSIFLPISQG